MKTIESTNSTACLKACKSDELCNYYSYNKERKICVVLKECQALDESQNGFESGQSECPLPSVNGTLGSLLSVQYVKQFRHPILRLYCTLNRDLYKILKTIHLIETYMFTFQPS